MKRRITVIPGDGIGPSLVESTVKVLDQLDCNFDYEYHDAGQTAHEKCGQLIPQETLDSMKVNRLVLKGPITTPIGDGFTSINVTLRKMFDLYANVRPAISYPGTKSPYKDIDMITIRENTEGMYSGQGQIADEEGNFAAAMSVMTKKGVERILRFAYELARKKGRKKVTAVHKANILKTTSGMFIKAARSIAKDYPDIESNEMIVDNTCMQLVMNPHQFDVIVTTNLFGDIISDLSAGLIGGLGMAPGGNIGKDMAMFEAVHGSAPDIAGKNIANPSSLLLASAMLLDHIGELDKGNAIRRAIRNTLAEKDRITQDLGGNGTTTGFTDAVIDHLQ